MNELIRHGRWLRKTHQKKVRVIKRTERAMWNGGDNFAVDGA